jgi:hypothetical protein
MGKCVKATITKEYFTSVQDRLNMKLNITPNLASMLTGTRKPGRISTDLSY